MTDNSNVEYALPRLNIAIYGIDGHLLEIASQLALDRRFINSRINVFGGGINAAINVYKNTMTPNILIIELDGDVNQMIGQLFELSEVCDPNTHVIVAGQRNDIELYRELLRYGISEYLVLPTSSTGLISIINGLFKDSAPPLSPAIAFIGAAGGVGSSMIAQSVALAIADHFKIETIFTDLDTAYALTSLSWSLVSNKNIDVVLQSSGDDVDESVLRSCLMKVTENLNLLTAPVDPLVTWNDEQSDKLLSCMTMARTISDFHVIDIPAGQLTIEKKIALMSATDVYIVADPTIKGIRNLGILYGVIKNLRPNDPPPKLILNRVGFSDTVHLDEKVIVDNIGIQPDFFVNYIDDVVDFAIARGAAISSISGADVYNEDIFNIANVAIGNSPVEACHESSFVKIFKNIQKTVGL